MNYTDQNKQLWEKHFANTTLDYPNEEVIRFLAKCKRLYNNGIMLDWGCATGRHTVLGCKFGFQVIAADYVENCVNITRNKVEKECREMQGKVLDYIVNKDLDIEQLDDNSLDVILAWGCIFNNTIEQQQIMMNNMYRMLKNGGRVFCDFRTQRDSIYQSKGKKIAEDTFLISSEATSLEGLCISIPSLENLKAMLQKSGFEIENIELYEFTQDNQSIRNSWWHVTLSKNV